MTNNENTQNHFVTYSL